MTDRGRVLDFIAGDRWINVDVDGQAALMRVLPALEVLRAKKEAHELYLKADDGEKDMGVYTTAAMLARCIFKGGERMFRSAGEVLEKISIGCMAELGEKMAALNEKVNASPKDTPEKIEQLRTLLGDDAWQRLRWQVMKLMGVLPGEQRLKDMTDGDFMYCVLNMWLDKEEALMELCPECREKSKRNMCTCCGRQLHSEESFNETFDKEKFRELMNR